MECLPLYLSATSLQVPTVVFSISELTSTMTAQYPPPDIIFHPPFPERGPGTYHFGVMVSNYWEGCGSRIVRTKCDHVFTAISEEEALNVDPSGDDRGGTSRAR